MNKKLVERIASELLWAESTEYWHCEVSMDEVVGRVVAEIAAAGFVLVPKDRWERVRELGRAAEDYGLSNDLGDWFWDAQDALQPGDLDGDV